MLLKEVYEKYHLILMIKKNSEYRIKNLSRCVLAGGRIKGIVIKCG